MTLAAPPRQRPLSLALVPLGLMFLAVGISVAVVFPFLSLFLSTAVHAEPVHVAAFLVAGAAGGVLVASTHRPAVGPVAGPPPDPRRRRRCRSSPAAGDGVRARLLGAARADRHGDRDRRVAVPAVVRVRPADPRARQPRPRGHGHQRACARCSRSPGSAARRSRRSCWTSAGSGWCTGWRPACTPWPPWSRWSGSTTSAPPRPRSRRGRRRRHRPGPRPPQDGCCSYVAAFVLLQGPMTLGVQAMPLFIGQDLHSDAVRARA